MFANPILAQIYTGLALSTEELPKLADEEEAIISSFQNLEAKKRFQAGRCAARRALTKLSPKLENTTLIRSSTGAAIWPKATVGSISHKKDLAVAVCGSANYFSTIGVDIEDIYRGDPLRLLKRIGSASEIDWASRQKDLNTACTVIFCCKESALKAMSSIYIQQILLTDISLTAQQIAGQNLFKAELSLKQKKAQPTELPATTELAPVFVQAALCDNTILSIAWQLKKAA